MDPFLFAMLAAGALCLVAKWTFRHDSIGSIERISVDDGFSLELDVDFEVILLGDGDEPRYLGIPRGALYHAIPESLWGDLARFIEEYRGAVNNEREYRAGVEDTYRRNRL